MIFVIVFARDSENGVLSDGYSIEFMFDTDVACAARLYLFATENLAGGIARLLSFCIEQKLCVIYACLSSSKYV